MKIIVGVLAAVAMLAAADTKIGKPLTLKSSVSVATVLAHPDEYVDKTVQVTGKITEVCQMMGCWVELSGEDGRRIHVQVPHGEVEFPKASAGKKAVVEGKLTKTELSREQAVERAEEAAKDSGRKFDPASVKSGMTVYEIQGTGAVIR